MVGRFKLCSSLTLELSNSIFIIYCRPVSENLEHPPHRQNPGYGLGDGLIKKTDFYRVTRYTHLIFVHLFLKLISQSSLISHICHEKLSIPSCALHFCLWCRAFPVYFSSAEFSFSISVILRRSQREVGWKIFAKSSRITEFFT